MAPGTYDRVPEQDIPGGGTLNCELVKKKAGDVWTCLQTTVSLHHLGFLGGIILFVDGIIGLIFGFGLGLDFIEVVVEVFMVLFGLMIVVVEGNERLLTALLHCKFYGIQGRTEISPTITFRRKLYHFARFLFIPYGRGLFYLYIMILLFAQWPDPVDFTVGCYFFLLTGMTLYVGHQTATKLQTFKFRFSSADELRSRASNLYEASSAVMSRENFKRFLNEELHLEFGPNAVDAAILAIDADQDECIGAQELEEWWGHDI